MRLCAVHPTVAAVATCKRCGAFACEACCPRGEHHAMCTACSARAENEPARLRPVLLVLIGFLAGIVGASALLAILFVRANEV